ncbi:MAG: hypothetical protein AB7P07_05645, partial [Hyphomonadaceae bacterium]
MRTWIKAAAAAAVLTLAGGGPALAQENEYEGQVRAYLDGGMAVHEALGYGAQRNVPDLVVPLMLEAGHLWAVNLRRGVNYRIYGACDDDCTDLDMEIYGNDGVLVDRDIALDDTPYVQITPVRSGPHYVRLWVYSCAAEPCYSGARVVSGGTPVERAVSEPIAAPGTGAPDDFISVVRAELADAGAAHQAAGYTPFGQEAITAVTLDSQGHAERFTLEAGRSYLFQGACDQDCTDVDMEIRDSSGA